MMTGRAFGPSTSKPLGMMVNLTGRGTAQSNLWQPNLPTSKESMKSFHLVA